MPASVIVRTIESMPFAQNSYLVKRSDRNDAVVIDPGLEPEFILDAISEEGLTLAAVLNTHGHADHIGGNAAMKQAFPQAPLIIGTTDAVMLGDARANLSAAFGVPITSPPADRLVNEEDQVEFAGLSFEVREIPGHSPGHVVFILKEQPILVFGGDVLFREGVGRYDFPGGSWPRLRDGIVQKLFSLPDNTIVYPGHGPVTTIAHEKRNNPYLASS